MKVRHRKGIVGTVRAGWQRLVLKLEDLAVEHGRHAKRARRVRPGEPKPQEPADERTMRRVAEAQNGGISSAESDARFARGENPGGMHHKAVRRDEGEVHPRPEREEPQGREERVPGGQRRLAETRRGS